MSVILSAEVQGYMEVLIYANHYAKINDVDEHN